MRRLAERRSYRSPPTRLSTGCQRLWLVRSRAQGAFHCPAHLPAGQPLLLPRTTTFITGPSKPVWRSVLCIQDVLSAAIAHPVLHLSFDVRYRVLTPRHKIMLNMLLISSAHIRDPLSTPQLRIDVTESHAFVLQSVRWHPHNKGWLLWFFNTLYCPSCTRWQTIIQPSIGVLCVRACARIGIDVYLLLSSFDISLQSGFCKSLVFLLLPKYFTCLLLCSVKRFPLIHSVFDFVLMKYGLFFWMLHLPLSIFLHHMCTIIHTTSDDSHFQCTVLFTSIGVNILFVLFNLFLPFLFSSWF